MLVIGFISKRFKKLSDLTVEQERLVIDHGDSLFFKESKIMKMPIHTVTACAATCLMLFVFGAHAADAQYTCYPTASRGPKITVTASSLADAEKQASPKLQGRNITCIKK